MTNLKSDFVSEFGNNWALLSLLARSRGARRSESHRPRSHDIEGLEGNESLISNSRLCLTIGWEPRTSWRDLRDQMEQDAEDADGDSEKEYGEGEEQTEPRRDDEEGDEKEDEDSAKF